MRDDTPAKALRRLAGLHGILWSALVVAGCSPSSTGDEKPLNHASGGASTAGGGTSGGGTSGVGATSGGSGGGAATGGVPAGGGAGGSATGGATSGGSGGGVATGGVPTGGTGGSATGGAPSQGQLVQGLNNPVIRHINTADPAALVHGDRVYVYAGHDETPVGGSNFSLHHWHVFSTSDMSHWTDHGIALSVSDFGWASWGAWAGHVTERNGKFYWYVPMSSSQGGAGFDIGVAIADSPTGPFVAQAKPVLTDNMTVASAGNGQPAFKDIDPAVFVDDDGQAYMYWGNIDPHIAKLAGDMVTIDGPIQYPKLVGFTEAPYMNKIGGTYFLTYASGWPEEIAYSTSTNPMGPWTWRGRLNRVTGSGTNHQSLIQFRDEWYFVYHNAGLHEGGEFRRSVCVDRLELGQDGLLQEVGQTDDGVSQLAPGPFPLEQGYQLINAKSGHALDLEVSSAAPGTNVVQHAATDGPTQTWHLEAVGAAVYRIVNASTDLCVGVTGNSLSNSANVEQVACADSPSQYWRATQRASGAWMFVNYASNRLLEVASASTAAGANVAQYPSLEDGTHQHWQVVAR